MASGPCGACPQPHDDTYTFQELTALRDEALAATVTGPNPDRTVVESWNGTDCPTTAQLGAMLRLTNKFSDEGVLTGSTADSCRYHVEENCPGGRPFLVAGQARVADVRAAELASCSKLAEVWLSDALMEHASVAAFARLSLHLLSLGAPAELVRDSQRASLDEVRHAEFCFDMASRYAGTQLLPGPLSVQGALDDLSLANLIECNLREGCISETLAAESMRRRAESATEPALRAALLQIAEDETRHAELAFQILAWCRAQAPELTRSVVQRVLGEGPQAPRSSDQAIWEHVISPLLSAAA